MGISSHGWCVLLVASLTSQSAGGEDASGSGRPIYRCNSADVVTFSDRPCDASAEIYAADARLNTFEPPKSSPRAQTATSIPERSSRSSDAAARSLAKLAERCQRIQESLRDIRSKMRAGYTGREGERLRARKSKLEDQRRATKCR